MSSLAITLACGGYDRVRPIMDGRVAIEGCDVNCFALQPEELFPRAFHTQDFDVTELSASSHILTTARGEANYVAIPAFISRVFRHGDIYIRSDRGIRSPADLRGKLVGVPEYQMTAALWARGILNDEYGVRAQDMRWRNGGQEQYGRTERTPITLPPEIELQPIPVGHTLSGMLESGELDALITAVTPSCVKRGAPNITRLFPDPRTAEEAYYRKTGMFPIMHLVGIRRSLVEAHPWLAGSVYKAFLKARELALAELTYSGAFYTMLPWLPQDVAHAQSLTGSGLWSYGVPANRKEIDAMLRWSVEQGLSKRAPKIEELFAPGTESGRWESTHSL